MMDLLDRHYGPFRTARVVPNGLAPAQFHCAEKGEFVLSVGRLWDAAKNVAILDESAWCVPWPIYLAGEEQSPGGGSVRIQRAQCLGRLEASELRGWLARASIYSLPARYEPFGLSALEAALSGCALVLGDIPSLREVWGEAALCVPPEDGEALRSAIQRLIAEPSSRAEMSAQARDRALCFTADRMAEGYAAAYRELQKGERPHETN